jgi:glycosyltransferase involved in cell wall biosynthesis
MAEKLVVVIPAYNEEPKVGSAIRGVQEQLLTPPLSDLQSEIIVIDDGSRDQTFREAKETGVLVLQHAVNLGLGAALGTGFEAARLRDATIVVTLDADGQHEPQDIPRLIEPILTREADLVIGSRLLNPDGMPWDRRIINWGANLFTLVLFGVWTTDSQSGLRALSRKALDMIEIRTNRMEVSSEIIAGAGRARLRLVEIPIRPIYTSYSRGKGQSNSNSISILTKLLLRRTL